MTATPYTGEVNRAGFSLKRFIISSLVTLDLMTTATGANQQPKDFACIVSNLLRTPTSKARDEMQNNNDAHDEVGLQKGCDDRLLYLGFV